MAQFNSKHWKTQIGFILIKLETSKKNSQRHLTNLLAKQPETTTPRPHATYPTTLIVERI